MATKMFQKKKIHHTDESIANRQMEAINLIFTFKTL